jgi:hypothetical protein
MIEDAHHDLGAPTDTLSDAGLGLLLSDLGFGAEVTSEAAAFRDALALVDDRLSVPVDLRDDEGAALRL